MKRKKIVRKRLNLNKQTLVNLNNAEMSNAVGGESLRQCSEPETLCVTFPIKECNSLDPQCPPSNTIFCSPTFDCVTVKTCGTLQGLTCITCTPCWSIKKTTFWVRFRFRGQILLCGILVRQGLAPAEVLFFIIIAFDFIGKGRREESKITNLDVSKRWWNN